MPTDAQPEVRPTVIVIGRFPPPRDGQSLATERLAELLAGSVDVIRFSTEPPDRGLVAADTRFRLDRLIHALRQTPRLFRVLRQHPGAAAVWTSISPTLLGHLRDTFTVLPVLGRKRAVIAVSHRATLNERFEDPRTMATMARLARRISAFVFLTEPISESVSRWLPAEKRHVIPNTIANGLRWTDAEVARKQEERQASDRLNLLFLSNMMPEKGWMDLLRALPLARRLGVPFHVRFAGRWVERADELQFKSFVLDNDLKDCVEHLGGLYDLSTIRDLYRSADALLLPTYHPTEGMPLVVLEAFAAGTPVIGTHQGGLATLIRDGENGVCVPPRNPVAIANAIAKITDRGRWTRLSDGARRTFRESFDRHAVLKSWLLLLEAVNGD